MYLRDGTQDFRTFYDVYCQNEYRVPEQFLDSEVVIDVGANVGCFALRCLHNGAGKVVCFEPEDGNYGLLIRNLGAYLPWVGTHKEAVWRSDQPPEGVRLEHRGAHTAMHRVAAEGQSVPSVGLDDVLREFADVSLLKVDAEGSEYPILMTSLELRRCRRVVVEYHQRLCPPGWGAEKTGVGPLQDYLDRAGFAVARGANTHDPEYVGLLFAERRP